MIMRMIMEDGDDNGDEDEDEEMRTREICCILYCNYSNRFCGGGLIIGRTTIISKNRTV